MEHLGSALLEMERNIKSYEELAGRPLVEDRSKLGMHSRGVSYREVSDDVVAYIGRRRKAAPRPVPRGIGSQEEEEEHTRVPDAAQMQGAWGNISYVPRRNPKPWTSGSPFRWILQNRFDLFDAPSGWGALTDPARTVIWRAGTRHTGTVYAMNAESSGGGKGGGGRGAG